MTPSVPSVPSVPRPCRPCFACAVLGFSAKLHVMSGHLLKAAKRIFDIPQFFYYALADGIKAIFARYPGQPKPLSPPTRAQLTLFPT